MDFLPIEELLRRAAGAVLADPRIVRRLIKQDREVHGVVPHARCYTIDRDVLFREVEPADVGGADASQLPARVIVVARPSPRELAGRTRADVLTRMWRAVFHARVHEAFERRIAAGELDDSEIRRRVDRIGQTEFDEARAILRHDDLVLPPHGDREVYVEFAALYLELRHFAPNLLVTTFPGLGDQDRIDAMLAGDVDISPLLDAGRPEEVQPHTRSVPLGSTSAPSFSAPASFGFMESLGAASVSPRSHGRLLRRAQKARERGNDVGAALLCARAASVKDEEKRRQAERDAREALVSLGKRLQRALQRAGESATRADWSALLFLVADRAAAERGIGDSPEARLLYGLQRAAIDHERGQRVVDVPGWLLSFGKRAVVRQLPATRELQVARHIHAAGRRLRNVRIGDADRKLLAKLLTWASERADRNARDALRPRIHRVLQKVGLEAKTNPEKLARDKLTEELMDEIVARGFLSFGLLRDGLSRNQLKLEDLRGEELLRGDALLKMDRELADELDGVYRRGDIYLRGLQVVSSVPFGTSVGRLLTLWCILPLGGAFIILEGIKHIVSPVLGWFGLRPLDALTPASFAVTAALILGLIHSSLFRALAWKLLEITGLLLATLFLRLPRALLTLPAVRALLARPGVRVALRRLVVPVIVAALAWWFTPYRIRSVWLGMGVGLSTFVLASVILGSQLGVWAEDFVFDQLAPSWQVLSRQWIPGLFRLISRFFTALMDLLQRALYFVDELLRFREGEASAMLVVKGVLGLGWAIVAYVIRLYVTLLVEPEINPLKHFPVVTVAHKLMIPVLPTLSGLIQTALAPFGALVASTVAWLTAFVFAGGPFGFLAWELKENYRLYRATRSDHLGPATIGPHGETMGRLLIVGLHSGSIPKLYERLRRAAQREDELAAGGARERRGGARGEGLGRFREGIRVMELCVRHFVERELCAPLGRCRRWRHGPISVKRVDLSSNRIRVQLELDAAPGKPCELTFEEQSGYVVAGIPDAGFLHDLMRDPFASLLFENALAGLYHRAQVDLVREQIEKELSGAHYDIADEGLIVWPGRDYRTELVYAIGGRRRAKLPPRVRGAEPAEPPRVLDTRELLFSMQAISWDSWVAAWTASDRENAEVSRLVQGASLLPPPDETPMITIRAS